MNNIYWSQIPKWKLAIYGILTVIIILAQETVAAGLVLVTGLYLGWRAFKLITHNIHCASCQAKLAGAALLFAGALFMAGPHMLLLLIAVLWVDALVIDRNETHTGAKYYG